MCFKRDSKSSQDFPILWKNLVYNRCLKAYSITRAMAEPKTQQICPLTVELGNSLTLIQICLTLTFS